MRRLEDNPWMSWFKIAMWIGIIANLLFVLPAVFAPGCLLDMLGLPYARDVIWLRDAGGLLFFLSLMYIGAARDPFRYSLNAFLAVVGRVLFAAFWFWMVLFMDEPRALIALGIGDALIGGAQLALYMLMMRHEYLRTEIPEQPQRSVA